jgi:hypothetical protein
MNVMCLCLLQSAPGVVTQLGGVSAREVENFALFIPELMRSGPSPLESG